MESIYLDYNATTPIAAEVAEVMRPYLDQYFGNPSSIHSFGVKSKVAVEKSRKQLADFLGCDISEVVFTSGGTEANNMAIKGIAYANRKHGNHIITSSIEHPAVFEVCRYLEQNGFKVSYLPVDEDGMVSIDELQKAITKSTILISIMHANNEVGTIQPIEKIAKIASEAGIIFHTDAAQSAGKIECNIKELGVDLLSIAGHKLYAPKGIGALYIKNGTKIEKFMHGADHEQNLRAGTENVLEIVGLGEACELAQKKLNDFSNHYMKTRDHLHKLLSESLPGIKLNGHISSRLPNTLSLSFPGVEANTLVSRLKSVAVSAGAACHAESIDVSAVLEAMELPLEYAMGTIRFSTGRATTMEDVENAATEIISVAGSLMQAPDSQRIESDIHTGDIKLTQYTHGLGCACKIDAGKLEKVLQSLTIETDERILVGTETSDDATVFALRDDLALVQTLDFFTPIVDDPYHFGAIAAANALSDIYAMGAKPIFALNIVGFPEKTLPMEVLEKILKGASDKAREAGINVLGGHTIEDPEPKFGMVVSGTVHPDKIIRNHGAAIGDSLILTKALGTGILSTALKRTLLDTELEELLVRQMSELNMTAADIMLKYSVSACTDVTGFGLLGHLREMSRASGLDVELKYSDIPFMEKVNEFATAGLIPGGSHSNKEFIKDDVSFGSLSPTRQLMLCDAQTSGGLLIAIPEKETKALLNELKTSGISDASLIGKFSASGTGHITIK